MMFCALSCQTYFDYEVRDDIRLKFHPLMLQGWGGGGGGRFNCKFKKCQLNMPLFCFNT